MYVSELLISQKSERLYMCTGSYGFCAGSCVLSFLLQEEGAARPGEEVQGEEPRAGVDAPAA